jgi:hypothetical protein
MESLNELLTEFNMIPQETDGNVTPEEIETPGEIPVVEPEIETPVEEAQPSVEETPSEDTEIIEETPTEEEVINFENIEDWDSSTVPEEEAEVDSFDFSTLSTDLGVEISSKENLVNKFKELSQKINILEQEKDSAFSNIPSDLRDALEVAKSGGDYLSFLNIATVDYSQYDPVDLFENEIYATFTDAQGNVNEEKANEYLDGLSDVEKEIQGKKIQKQYIDIQKRKAEDYQQKVLEKKHYADQQLKSVIDKTDQISGYKLTAAHKQSLYSDITSGKLFQDLFYGANGDYDFKKLVEVGFKAKNFDKLQNYLKTKIKNSTKKEVIQSITNAELEKSTQPVETRNEQISPLDSYMKTLENNLLERNK